MSLLLTTMDYIKDALRVTHDIYQRITTAGRDLPPDSELFRHAFEDQNDCLEGMSKLDSMLDELAYLAKMEIDPSVVSVDRALENFRHVRTRTKEIGAEARVLTRNIIRAEASLTRRLEAARRTEVLRLEREAAAAQRRQELEERRRQAEATRVQRGVDRVQREFERGHQRIQRAQQDNDRRETFCRQAPEQAERIRRRIAESEETRRRELNAEARRAIDEYLGAKL